MTLPTQTPLTDEVFAAVRAWQPEPPWKQVDSIQKNRAAWETEVTLVCADPSIVARLLARELPSSAENDIAIATMLDRVQLLAGHFQFTKQLIEVLVAGYMAPLPQERRQVVLRAITSDTSEISMRANWLTRAIRTLDFPVEFLHAWFLEVLPADGSGSGFWSVVGEFTAAKPEGALAMASIPQLDQTPIGRQLRVRLLAGLRFNPAVPSRTAEELAATLAGLAGHLDPERRIDYLRTYKEGAWRGDIPTEELRSVMETLNRATAAEQSIGFELATAIISGSSSKEHHMVVLHWLRGHALPQCTSEQKLKVAEAVWRTWKSITIAELGFDQVTLLFAIQPVAANLAGVWRDIEHTLQEMMHAEPDRFRQTVRALAQKHWRALRDALDEGKAFEWLLGELGQLPWVEAFVTGISGSTNRGERRLGAYLFEALKLQPSAGTPAAKFDTVGFRTWLAEFQTRNVYETVAAQLVAAAQRVDEQDEWMVQQFQSEAYYQCLNLPGRCLAKIRQPAATLPLLQHVVEAADAYFKTLSDLRDSPIKAQQIPSMRRYEIRKAQLDRRRMQEMADKNSIFAQAISKSYLIYGNQHAYLMEGDLSSPSGLQEFSHSFEMPRIDCIDPEAANHRQLNALATLAELRRDEESGPAEIS
ncbi:MAG TPA: hypothetical protein VL357_02505 [Rariglobus sp.]|jgi:hypothetical protein|nr:hypothetical protein [Rariglobus sp.]